jgi:hypothetical protein
MDRAEEIFNRIVEKGESAIDDFILTRISEELFLDFKRSSDNGSARILSQTDRNNLAKAISGFGNSEGGVVIWGVDCSKDIANADIARTKVPITDAKRFRSWLEGSVSGCTVPPHSGVRNEVVLCGQSQDGFVVTLVPKSNSAPHQVVGKLQYYVRAGSDFVPAPHGVLAGMFGRRPQPLVGVLYLTGLPKIVGDTIHAEVGLVVSNWGQGIAKDVFLNASTWSTPGENSHVGYEVIRELNWGGTYALGFQLCMISEPAFRLPPEAKVQPVVMKVELCPPFTREFRVAVSVGAAHSPQSKAELKSGTEQVAEIYHKYSTMLREGRDGKGFIEALFHQPDTFGT